MVRANTLLLKLRLFIATTLLMLILLTILILITSSYNMGGPGVYASMAIVLVFVQYMIGPIMVEKMMHVHYVSKQEAPKLHAMVEDLAMKADVPKPKIGIADINIPNAFAFGRTKKDGRICVTRGILKLFDQEELEAVLGHEMSHIKHSDMAVMTLISVVPLICYYIFISTMFSGDRNNNSGYGFIIGIAALGAYLVGQILVLFVSRTREYYADEGSVELGGKPHKMASALYKLVYGSATINKDELKEVEGLKAFFANDISNAGNEINDLQQLDINMDGVISEEELSKLRYSDTKIGTANNIMELLSTHPNMVKRVKRLSELA